MLPTVLSESWWVLAKALVVFDSGVIFTGLSCHGCELISVVSIGGSYQVVGPINHPLFPGGAFSATAIVTNFNLGDEDEVCGWSNYGELGSGAANMGTDDPHIACFTGASATTPLVRVDGGQLSLWFQAVFEDPPWNGDNVIVPAFGTYLTDDNGCPINQVVDFVTPFPSPISCSQPGNPGGNIFGTAQFVLV